MSQPRILVYLLRRDLRLADNPIFHDLVKSYQQSNRPYTHLLPLYVFPAQQIEVSGFLSESERSPYPEARSPAGGFWRCGKHRAKFLAESLFDLRKTLQGAGSGLEIQVGMIQEVVKGLLDSYETEENEGEVVGLWMTAEEGVEEKREERAVKRAVEEHGKEFRLWQDEKYFIDDRDAPSKRPNDLPDLFTAYRKQVEPLREAPRKTLSVQGNLPPLPPTIPSQEAPFRIPSTLEDTISCLYKPLDEKPDLVSGMKWPSEAKSAHPFIGGESTGHERVKHLLSSGSMTTYKDTRNGMIGTDFSTKLSAWLALGCITARQIHFYLLDFEDGRGSIGKGAQGYGKGENKGTGWVRFELLWRDYMRLCTRKHKQRLFHVEGFEQNTKAQWKYPQKDKEVQANVKRFLEGSTGMGMVDASMKELYLTGYTSNRARQNVGSFLAKHMGVDWRIGAEWYESNLVDYDVSSNWGNWQAVSLSDRVFNPVKQSFDYDKKGEYIKLWVEELRKVERVEGIFQAWKLSEEERKQAGLLGVEWVEQPLKRIDYQPRGEGKGGKGRGGYSGRGRGKKYRGQVRRGQMDRAQAEGAM